VETFLICLVFLLVIVAGMSIGLLRGRRVKGSCGGVTRESCACSKENANDRLTQMKRDPNRRIDSDNMSEIEKMDRGFTHGTYNINGRDVDF
jgi:hypothetical protein